MGDTGCHRLNDVLDVIEFFFDNPFAQGFEALNVQRDVVIDKKDRPRPVCGGIPNIAMTRSRS
jgi:hypothetical protein